MTRPGTTRRATVRMWARPARALAGVIGSSLWWMAAAALSVAALARLAPPPHADVVGAGALFVVAAGCVLGAGLATRRARTRRWTGSSGRPARRRGRARRPLTNLAHLLDMICTRDTTIWASRNSDATGTATGRDERRVIIPTAPEPLDHP